MGNRNPNRPSQGVIPLSLDLMRHLGPALDGANGFLFGKLEVLSARKKLEDQHRSIKHETSEGSIVLKHKADGFRRGPLVSSLPGGLACAH